MALPKVSKMVKKCQEKYDAVARFVHAHRQMLVDALEKAVQPDPKEDETAPEPSMFVDGFLRRLGTLLAEIVNAERRYISMLAALAAGRAERDHATRELRALLFELRDLFRASYGQTVTDAVGFARRIREELPALLRLAQRILDQLHRRDLVLPSARFATSKAPRTIAIEALESMMRRLLIAVDRVAIQRQLVRTAREAKLEAIHDFSTSYRSYADWLKAVCRFGGRRDLVHRLQLVSSRRTRSSGSETS